MDAVVQQARQKESQVLLNLFSVQKTSTEAAARPLRPIGSSGQNVDTYA
jgi:hypothetical protein